MASEANEEVTRPETGPMQFGGDWPGIFLRGDDAFRYALVIGEYLEAPTPWFGEQLQGLRELLLSCDIRLKPEAQKLGDIRSCVAQLVERPAVNRMVGGSNPPAGAR